MINKIRFKRMSRVQRMRRGYDATWLIIIAIILLDIIAGILCKKGLLTFIP